MKLLLVLFSTAGAVAALQIGTLQSRQVGFHLVARQSDDCSDFGYEECGDSCIEVGYECCQDSQGAGCPPDTYCTTGDDGVGACCEDGSICSGPGGINTDIVTFTTSIPEETSTTDIELSPVPTSGPDDSAGAAPINPFGASALFGGVLAGIAGLLL